MDRSGGQIRANDLSRSEMANCPRPCDRLHDKFEGSALSRMEVRTKGLPRTLRLSCLVLVEARGDAIGQERTIVSPPSLPSRVIVVLRKLIVLFYQTPWWWREVKLRRYYRIGLTATASWAAAARPALPTRPSFTTTPRQRSSRASATLGKPLSRKFLFYPSCRHLWTPLGSGFCVSRELRLPRIRAIKSKARLP